MRAGRVGILVSLILAVGTGEMPRAHAKSVSIEWEPVSEAISYDLELKRDGKGVRAEHLSDGTRWSGKLDPGYYEYRIRGIDRLKQAGAWTEPHSLVVLPPAPEAKALPASQVVYYGRGVSGVDVPLSWETVPGISRYRVEVWKDGKIFQSALQTGTGLVIKGVPPGDYRWQVSAAMEPSGRSPASLRAVHTVLNAIPKSKFEEFSVQHRELATPIPVAPLGRLPLAEGRRLLVKWKAVEGAQAYRVELQPVQRSRGPASGEKVQRYQTTKNSLEVNLAMDGRYVWKVRAIASLEKKESPEVVGPQSVAEFELDRNLKFFEGSGYLALSTMVAPYTYRVISPATNAAGDTGSAAVTARVSGEYYFHPQWGVGAAVEATHFKIGRDGFDRKTFELQAKYRMTLTRDAYPWSLAPRVGLESRDYFEIFSQGARLPQGINTSAVAFNVGGISAGLDLRKQFSQRLSVGLKTSYFYPLAVLSGPVGGITGDASLRNISAGAQGFYWLDRKWGAGLGMYWEKRSISYSRIGTASSANPEQVFLDGYYFFGSLVYSFGR